MAQRSTVLSEYSTILKERERDKKLRVLFIIGVVLLIIGLVSGGIYYWYNHSTASWDDYQWYEHALNVLADNKEETNYWSVSGNTFLQDNDQDYDNNCLEYFYFYVDTDGRAYSVTLENSCFNGRRVDYENSQRMDAGYDQGLYYLTDVTDSYYNDSYISKSEPGFIRNWASEFSLDNVFLPAMEDMRITYSYRENNEDLIYVSVSPYDLPENMYNNIMTSMFGADYDENEVIITECQISFEIKKDHVTDWNIDVTGSDSAGTYKYSRRYYLSYDESYVNIVKDGIAVSDWSEVEEVRNMWPLNYRDYGEEQEDVTGI